MKVSDIKKVCLVGGSSNIPWVSKLLHDYFGHLEELDKTVQPDEYVAYGAAITAAHIGGLESQLKEVCVTDVTPLSLGINTKGGYFVTVI